MKKIVCIIATLLLLPIQALAVDNYDKVSNSKWQNIMHVQKGIVLKSKYKTTRAQAKQIKRMYHVTRRRFKEFTGIDANSCKIGYLEIRIIGLDDLSNELLFPNEHSYSTHSTIIIGRYFRKSNYLYLVPRYYHSNWHRNFAHELLHHFLDECGIMFENDDKEHEVIYQFERKYYGDIT